MDGPPRSSTARRLGARASRAALVAVIALIGFVAMPGTASAAERIEPILDCHRQNTDGSFTVVAGYVNPGAAAQTIPLGRSNRITPTRLDGVQPTTFQPGTHHGAFTVTVTKAEVDARARWELGSVVLNYKDAAAASRVCPASTELPADGNGIGPAIALAAAGVVAGVLVHRAKRRVSALTPGSDSDA